MHITHALPMFIQAPQEEGQPGAIAFQEGDAQIGMARQNAAATEARRR